MERIKDIR